VKKPRLLVNGCRGEKGTRDPNGGGNCIDRAGGPLPTKNKVVPMFRWYPGSPAAALGRDSPLWAGDRGAGDRKAAQIGYSTNLGRNGPEIKPPDGFAAQGV